jgi:hypothetical protein
MNEPTTSPAPPTIQRPPVELSPKSAYEELSDKKSWIQNALNELRSTMNTLRGPFLTAWATTDIGAPHCASALLLGANAIPQGSTVIEPIYEELVNDTRAVQAALNELRSTINIITPT